MKQLKNISASFEVQYQSFANLPGYLHNLQTTNPPATYLRHYFGQQGFVADTQEFCRPCLAKFMAILVNNVYLSIFLETPLKR